MTTLANRSITPGLLVLLLATGFLSSSCTKPGTEGELAHQPEMGMAMEEPVKGPHGGRLLSDADVQVEVTIFETGVPPQYRVYVYDNKKPIDPGTVNLTIELSRLGGRVDQFHFVKERDYLVGNNVVEEPHSFEVKVTAQYKNQTHQWEYPSYEGRTEFSPEALKGSGIVIETAGPAKIKRTIATFGRIEPNEDRVTQVIPRFPGVIKDVGKRLGDRVSVGEVIAIVESNESLRPYEIKASSSGTIIEKRATAGEYAQEGQTIYVVADLRTVWVDLNIYQQDFHQLKIGQVVTVEMTGDSRAQGKIIYLSPFGSENTQTMLARVLIANDDGRWRPGLFVTAEILVDDIEVPLAVKTSGLQTFRDWNVVFLNVGNVFEIRPLELGRRHGEWVEVLEGLKVGDRYAADNSFIIKADIGKSGATHDH